MDFQKIKTDNDFLNAVVPEGQILLFSGTENGKPVTRYKDSSGNFGTLSGGGGGGGGADVTLGQIDAAGSFQPLAFNGTEASNDGSPETVESYYGWNGTLPSPEGGITVIHGSGGITVAPVYYKCASVDTANKTWSGYLAVLTDGVYTFEDTATTGLTYGTAYTPTVNKIYTSDAAIEVTRLWSGIRIPEDYVLYIPLATSKTTAETGQTLTAEGNAPTFGEVDGIPCAIISDGGYTISPCVSELQSNTPFTVSIWVRTDNTETACFFTPVPGWSGVASAGFIIGLNHEQDKFSVMNYAVRIHTTQTYDLTKWHHVCVTHNGSSTIAMYIDGNAAGEGEAWDINPDTRTPTIGGYSFMAFSSNTFYGNLASARIYDRVLTADEITSLASEFTPTA